MPLPAYIEEKTQQLKARQETVGHLQNQLAIETEECRRLKKELELYHASVAPIRGCPTEIISMSFGYYVAENPRLIRRLLLVCRLWHDIAINTPRFWTTIKVKTTDQDNAIFIKACLEHSAESLLHVDINFGGADISPSNRPEIVRSFICLTGTQGSLMWRWKTASITFPDDDDDEFNCRDGLIESIWDTLVGPTPNLTELTLRGVWHMFSDCVLLPTQGFPDSGALKCLTVDDAFDEEVLEIPPTSLEYLSIHLDLGKEVWPHIHRFTSLQTLVLNSVLSSPMDDPRPAVYDLRLPLLHTVAFVGWFTRPQSVNFHCPSLHHIAFVPRFRSAHYELTSLQPKTISWGIFEGMKTYSTEIYSKGMLKKVLLYYRTVESLKIPERAEKPVLEVIEELRNSQSLPGSLKVLLVVSPGLVRSIPILSE